MATIRVRGKKKQIYMMFRYSGRQMQEPTQYICDKKGEKDCKCRGCKAALALAGEIERKIHENVFELVDYFPKSKALLNMGLSMVSVDDGITLPMYAMQWLEITSGLRSSTITKYKQSINKARKALNMPIKDIKPYNIKGFVKMMESSGMAPKTIKEHMSTISGIFKSAVKDRIISENPCADIRLPKVEELEPDPFSPEEITLILDWIGKKYPDKVAFYAIGFYTGMRTGEILGLKWSAVDFNQETIKVNRQHTGNEEVERTKTGTNRIVDIIPQLMPYIQAHKQYTFMKSEYLFLSQYNTPYMTSDDLSRYYWQPCLKALGIRFRTVYHMRHTFACVMLNNNMPPNWIAKRMLGHKNTSLLFKTYGNYWSGQKPSADRFNFLNGVVKSLPNQEDTN
jgi:integrase